MPVEQLHAVMRAPHEAVAGNLAAEQVADVLEAALEPERLARMQEIIPLSPLIDVPDAVAGAGWEVFDKNDGALPGGSYKLYGPVGKLSLMQARGERVDGVVVASTGNHAVETAIAAQAFGIRLAEGYCPTGMAGVKLNQAEAHGMKIDDSCVTFDDALAAAEARGQDPGMVFIHPFNDPESFAHHGLSGLSAMQQLEARGIDPNDPTNVITYVLPGGGGGYAAANVVALAMYYPNVRVVVSQLKGGDGIAMARRGEVVDPVKFNYACRGAAVPQPGELALEIINDARFDIDLVSVDMWEVYKTQGLLEEYHARPEASGALAMAAAQRLGAEDAPDDSRRHILVAATSGVNSSPEEDADFHAAWLAHQNELRQQAFGAMSLAYLLRSVYGIEELLARRPQPENVTRHVGRILSAHFPRSF
ncbi:MAG TPA: pyridoxal-phosphate dependent enzyme [Candidatus Saccharimonadales bacterium]|nr:pyridoxal-phosphate dependent enzyme [Candidatus Saccharimonadales bacterium]